MDPECNAQQRRLLYLYKEIINGESYIELAEEERQCLEKAMYQEEYDIKRKCEEKINAGY